LAVKPEKLSNIRPDLVFPAKLEKIVQKAVEKETKLRFQKIGDFEAQLKELLMQIEATPSILKAPPPVVRRVCPPGQESEQSITDLLAEPVSPSDPARIKSEDRWREGAIDFLAVESMDGVPWLRIYADVMKTYDISEQEVLHEKRRIV